MDLPVFASPAPPGPAVPFLPVPAEIERLAAALADRYTIERELGSGGMATVYLARDLKHDRLVAVKVLHPDLAASLGAERFLREIRVTARLSHPHILPLYDSGDADGLLYYVMPYVEGESLAAKLQREKQLSIRETVQIVREIAEALAHAHSYGLVHRDIKPDNVLMSGGHAIVADFGIATAVEHASGEKLTQTGMAIGTPAYMSPEQAMGEAVDGRSDIYSLGCMLYEMLVGQIPFTGATPQQIIARHSMDHIPTPSMMRDTIPQDLEEIILRSMAKVPADRFRTAFDLAEALGSVDTATLAQRRPSVVRPGLTPRPASRWLLPGVAALTLLALAAGAWAVFGPRRHAVRPVSGGLDLKRVAVLYFDDLSPDSSLGPIADGLTEGLIRQLAAVPALSVVSHNGVEPFRGLPVPRDSIGRSLGAGTIVVGSVEPSGRGDLRITTRLVDGASGADAGYRASFVMSRDALLEARDSVSQDAARILRRWLGEEVAVRQSRSGASSAAVWTLLQQAEKLRKTGELALIKGDAPTTADAGERADSLLAAANETDPDWPDPLVLRARVAYLRAQAASASQRVALVQQGLALAERALALDPADAPALEWRGTLRYALWRLNTDPDPGRRRALLDSAYGDLQAAVRADPTLASAYATLSRLDHDREDLVEEALAARAAYAADAYLRDAPAILSRLFFASYNLGQFPDARRSCDEGARRFPADYRFAECQLYLMTTPGAEPDVPRAWGLAARLDSLAPPSLRPLKHRLGQVLAGGAIGKAGLRDSADRVLVRARTSDPGVDPEQDLPGYEAAMRALIGDADGAVGLLKRYVATHPEHSFQIGGILHWWWRDLERRPDFQSLLRVQH